MKSIKTYPWDSCFAAKAERLRAPETWFPFPLILSFVLILQFTAHSVFSTSARIGSPAEVLEFPSPQSEVGILWFAVAAVGDEIFVTTEDRKIFRWKQDLRSLEGMGPFRSYLKEKVKEVVFSATLSKETLRQTTRAVIAADQRLKYLHIRPILYALAEANIVQYGFETKIPEVAINADHMNQNNIH